MPAPFYLDVKGVTVGAAAAGAYTPSGAASGALAWSTVPGGWWGLVRFDDGAAWEYQYCYWNTTTLTRSATNQFVASSTGSALSLSAAATAALVIDPAEVMPHPGGAKIKGVYALPNAITFGAEGTAAPASTGTLAAVAPTASNLFTEQQRVSLATSVTTAGAQASLTLANALYLASSTGGRGGWEWTAKFGIAVNVTGPRFFCGMTAATFVGNAAEPSAFVQNYAVFGKDSTDANFQLMTNSNVGAATKIDTGITPAANGLYEMCVWSNPGSLTVNALLVDLVNGTIFYRSTATDVPVTATLMFPQFIGGLGTVAGTAINMGFVDMTVRGSV